MDPNAIAILAVRLVIGGTLIAHGVNHWRGGGRIPGTARWFESLGLRYGRFQAWASVVTEIGAGVMLILGLFTSLAAAAVISVMAVAGLLAHRRNGFFVFKDGYEYVLVLGVVSAAIAMSGPGPISMDQRLGLDVTGWIGGGVAVVAAAVATTGLLASTLRRERDIRRHSSQL